MHEKYVEVIVPLPVKGSFTYSIEGLDDNISIGKRVVVQFGARKIYTGIVIDIHNNKPEYKIKKVLEVIDDNVLVDPIQIKFWKWISLYYISTLGDVMNAAIPASLKLASESKIIIHPYFDGDISGLNSKEIKIVESLTSKIELNINDIVLLLHQNLVFPIINNLIRKEIIQIKEELIDSFKFKVIKTVQLVGQDFESYYRKIKNAKKQEELLNFIISNHTKFPNKKWIVSEVLKKSGISRSVLNALIEKNILMIESHEISRLTSGVNKLEKLRNLTIEQERSIREIRKSFKEKDVCLLHGVTSSGKTEIYIKLIEEQIKKGKQVLYLLPEIALTTQIINKLKKYFGNDVGVYHSNLSNSERVEVWNAVKEKDDNKMTYKIILGARSSLFLPFKDLGLVLVDEEHDQSFKQHNPTPRYHARDSSIYLASLYNAKVLLGSATPSIETYYNAINKKYGHVELNVRYGDLPLPKIHIVDIRKLHLKRKMQYHFSPFLIENIRDCLINNRQVILFQNRRGYAPILECDSCNWSVRCKHCDVSLTYHKYIKSLRCHYCGYTNKIFQRCQNCRDGEMIDKGFGTEQIEEDIKSLFPNASVERMDHDTTRGKYSYKEIIHRFESRSVDILIGTQMVTKGLDFDNVHLVGILNADSMLKFPDFRSLERSYQLMSQVSGRSGRKEERGQVIIQTYDNQHEIINHYRLKGISIGDGKNRRVRIYSN